MVGQAGKPKSITGFATHTTPVLVAYDQVALLQFCSEREGSLNRRYVEIKTCFSFCLGWHLRMASPQCLRCERMQRAELANDQYLALTSVLEGFVILKPNPDWKPDGEKMSPSKKKVICVPSVLLPLCLPPCPLCTHRIGLASRTHDMKVGSHQMQSPLTHLRAACPEGDCSQEGGGLTESVGWGGRELNWKSRTTMTSRSWRSKWRMCAPTSACTASERMAPPQAVPRAYGPGQRQLGERGRRCCARSTAILSGKTSYQFRVRACVQLRNCRLVIFGLALGLEYKALFHILQKRAESFLCIPLPLNPPVSVIMIRSLCIRDTLCLLLHGLPRSLNLPSLPSTPPPVPATGHASLSAP